MNANQPAFPQHGWSNNPEVVARMEAQKGLTKREEFAKAAMQGLLANPLFSSRVTTLELTAAAVNTADALLAELAKTEVKP